MKSVVIILTTHNYWYLYTSFFKNNWEKHGFLKPCLLHITTLDRKIRAWITKFVLLCCVILNYLFCSFLIDISISVALAWNTQNIELGIIDSYTANSQLSLNAVLRHFIGTKLLDANSNIFILTIKIIA